METLAGGASFIDLAFQATPRVIATAVLHGPSGVGLIDPGPTSTLPSLERQLSLAGIGLDDVTAILLTHIHLDHAGATGTIVRNHPRIRVYVHREGAKHLVNPVKLVSSASRLYGAAMDRLWGEVQPVPEMAVMVLEGGEQVMAGGRRLAVAYTPGHASHHVSYFNEDTGIAFVGDTGGVKLSPAHPVAPATPPPDIDLEAWSASLTRIEAWRPDTLFLTHFGPVGPVDVHVAEVRDCLDKALRLVRASLEREEDDTAREAWFVQRCRVEVMPQLDETGMQLYESAARLDLSWRGLARYLRKRAS